MAAVPQDSCIKFLIITVLKKTNMKQRVTGSRRKEPIFRRVPEEGWKKKRVQMNSDTFKTDSCQADGVVGVGKEAGKLR